MNAQLSATQLQERLGWEFAPTPEQAAIIEFARPEPALIVAGAGSGKTQTMAQRVIWLVANGLAAPGEILGLTFTRKATRELSTRVASNLRQLRRSGIVETDDMLDAPTIVTYNSFANTIFRDNALRVGREPESVLLTEAGSWQLAYNIVRESTDPRLEQLDSTPAQVTRAVLRVAHAMSEHIADPAQLAAVAAEFPRLLDLPVPPGRKGAHPSLAKAVSDVASLDVLLPMCAEFERQKARRGLVEYSDQMRFALRAVTSSEAVVADYRSRYRYVLLDEYQDTSVLQTTLLSRLFADSPVMAVGDPHQSIYGWRGASAANLARFARDFSAQGADYGANTFTLSVSWRNDDRILDLANAIASPLAQETSSTVVTLRPRPTSGPGTVEYRDFDSIADEASGLAELIAAEFAADALPRVAMLFRTRKSMSWFADALHARGIPAEIVGVGGVLESPEVTDLICALHVVHSPDSGNELIRLLTGSRWRLGARDIAQLSSLAHKLSGLDPKLSRLDPALGSRVKESTSLDDSLTIVDALDFISTARHDLRLLDEFSQLGIERLRDAGATFARLRSAVGRPLPDLVRTVAHELMLDIEVFANPATTLPRRHLDAFEDKVREYVASAADATLGAFLAWIDYVQDQETLSAEQPEPEPGTVQLLTVHAAKGLEWDVVAIPRFVVDEFPAAPKVGMGWMRFGYLPNELRGDAADIPRLTWRDASDALELREYIDAYIDDEKHQRDREERRIAYVALTRARRRLILTSSRWVPGRVKPLAPSPYLAELGAVLEAAGAAVPTGDGAGAVAVQPPEREPMREVWPLDPLGTPEHRARVTAAAEAVRAADPDRPSPWRDDIDLLLAERAESSEQGRVVDLPASIAASHFADFVSDPEQMALAVARPVPQRPSAAARLGTAFHTWVEQRYRTTGLGETLDDSIFDGDSDNESGAVPGGRLDHALLETLQQNFLRRREWADRQPVDVEVSVQLPLNGRVVPCKLDAVFASDDGYIIVDWKTGEPPRSADDLERKQLQLALYRLAYASWKRVDPSLVDAVFYYVASDEIIRPTRLLDAGELARLWEQRIGA